MAENGRSFSAKKKKQSDADLDSSVNPPANWRLAAFMTQECP